jgi:type IV pilus assembly protein PilM
MARTNAVWGIDVGQCALKALRCRADDEPGKLIAEAFDFIEYPKILSQPGSDPAQLIGDALKLFLSRNSVAGDRVAISVPGQSGLARFIKLPPVEAKKIPEIVRYEARQQIPFDLNDVIWDYQRMGGGSEEEGFALETEIGLFAMKREAVFRALEPFQQAGIELDYVQLTPLALYNFVLFDELPALPPPDQYDPEDPPESVVVISLGTDSTDLVVTNGYRVWQRSIPLGGSHFTKSLTKELKLTFAKAEHLKRNATTAQDPKAVFQAMRPVFSDFLTELQRSLGYFSNIDRAAKIGRVVALGNAFKLPGLRKYLSQSLGYEIHRIDCFRALSGADVVAAPAFKDNILSFGVCYGLVLQGLGQAGLRTNLLPKQILKDRLIREKKPWAVTGAATLVAATALSFAGYWLATSGVDQGWQGAENAATTVQSRSTQLKADAETAKNNFLDIKHIGEHLVSNVEGRPRWLDLLYVINHSLPEPEVKDDRARFREQLHIINIDCQQVEDVGKWYAGLKNTKMWYEPPMTEESLRAALEGTAASPAAALAATPAVGGPAPGVAGAPAAPGAPAAAAPTAPGAARGPAVPGAPAPAPAAPGAAAMPTPPAGPGAAPMGAPAVPGATLPPGAPAAPPAMAGMPGAPAPAGVPAAPGAAGAPAAGTEDSPTGPGFIIQIKGKHYHNDPEAKTAADKVQGAEYVKATLIRNLLLNKFKMPTGKGKATDEFTAKEMGIVCPVIVMTPDSKLEDETFENQNPLTTDRGVDANGRPKPASSEDAVTLKRFKFTVHFVWRPVPVDQRHPATKDGKNAAPGTAAAPAAPGGPAAPGAPTTPGAPGAPGVPGAPPR